VLTSGAELAWHNATTSTSKQSKIFSLGNACRRQRWHVNCTLHVQIDPHKGCIMVTDRERRAVDDNEPEVDLNAVKQVREVVQAMSKFIHGKKIYAKNNPTLVKFAAEFRDTFRAYFKNYDELVLAIEQNTLRWEEQVVYEDDKRDDNLAFLLYKDGIGELSIPGEVSDEELETFIDIIKQELHSTKANTEDVVTQLWKADFECISYRVLDEYLDGEYGNGRDASSTGAATTPLEFEDHVDLLGVQDKGREIIDTKRYGGSIEGYLAELVEKTRPECPADERDEVFQQLVESLFSVSSDELKRCQRELEKEQQRDALVDFMESILFFALQDNPSSFRDLCNIIDSITDYILDERQPTTLAETLLILRAFIGDHDLSESVAAYFQKIEDKFTDTTYLHSLGSAVETWGSASTDLIAYYRQVGKRVVPALSALLESIDSRKAHQLMCEVLVDVAADELARIIEGLNMDNPLIAHDAARLLGEIPTQTIPAITHELMFYPDLRVREEVIRFLGGVGNEDATLMLVRLLEHDDKSTRTKTLIAMEELNSPIAANKLMALAFDKELSDKTMDEQEQVFRTLGKCAGDRALPQIKKMLDKKSAFGFGRSAKQQNKVLAIRALEHIQSVESVKILRSLASDSNSMVKSKAQRALKALHSTSEA
jgi:hypothetical protein